MGIVGNMQSQGYVIPQLSLSINFSTLEDLNQLVQKFWEFEDLPLCISKNAEHDFVEKVFEQEQYRDLDGKFVVAMPLKPIVEQLGSSRAIAMKRFFMLEKKFRKDPIFKQKYIEFMNDFEQKGHMIRAEPIDEKANMTYYIPHHGVVTSKKFRVVFDSSCITNAGISLNDIQLVGAKLQKELIEILMRFRRWKVAISADIKQMFRQVKIVQEQWNLQRILYI